MPFSFPPVRNWWHSYPWRVSAAALAWLLVITILHLHLNADREKRPVVSMGYMPVITNLAAPLLDYASSHYPSRLRFRAIKFASFAEMAEALRNGEIQAAFMIAPLPIVLRQQGEQVRIVYIGNRHESTLVVRKELHAHSLGDLEGRTVAVPMRYSGHNLVLRKLIEEAGLNDRVRIVEMNPPDMAGALAAGSLDAYFVGEPFAAQTLKAGLSELLFHVEDVCPGFICNLLVVNQSLIDRTPDAVRMLVDGAVRSGLWAQQHRRDAARIASAYWGQPVDVISYALDTPHDRIVFDRYIPLEAEIQQIADLMVRFGLSAHSDCRGLIEDTFSRQASRAGISDIASILEVTGRK